MKRSIILATLLSLSACDENDAAQSTIRVTAWGEDFIEVGIPADEFVDGWSVSFEAFYVSISGIDAEGDPLPGTFVVDVSQPSNGSGQELGLISTRAGGPPNVAWALVPAEADAITDIAAAELDEMARDGATVWARGVAVRADERKTFDWRFDTSPVYERCETETSRTEGQTTDVVLTIHADHLFYDDLDSEEPGVAFDLIAAADRDGDGAVTMDELRMQTLDGQVRYQVGGRDIADLGSFIRAQVETLGHINGEGHCDIR